MIYTKTFSLSDFEWTGVSKGIVETIKNAGKGTEFEKLVEDRFDSEDDTASDLEIDKWVADNAIRIMGGLGLALDGKPVKKKYKVFLRITATDIEEIEASSPEEAREKAKDGFYDNFDDMFMTIMREDVESAVPVAYDEGDGETKDYPHEEQEDPSGRRQVWALTRMDGDDGNFVLAPSVSLFSSEKEATDEMASRYRYAKRVLENRGMLDMFQDPEDGIVTCYASGKDGHEVRFHVSAIEGIDERK